MCTLHIKAWHPDRGWAGEGGFTHLIVSRRLESIASVRGVALRRLTRRLLRREIVDVPLRDGADPETFLSYLAGYGAEVAISPVSHPVA